MCTADFSLTFSYFSTRQFILYFFFFIYSSSYTENKTMFIMYIDIQIIGKADGQQPRSSASKKSN